MSEYSRLALSQKVNLTAHSNKMASGAMNLRISIGWLCGLAVMLASPAGLAAQDRVKSAPSFPPGEPVIQNPQSASTNPPGPGITAPSAKSSQVPPAPNEKVAAGQIPPGAYVSPWLLDIIKLAQARIDPGVMLTFIDSAGTFNLDADQIIFLRDLGVPAEVTTAMIQHDFEIVSGLRMPGGAVSASQPAIQLTFVHSDSPSAGAAAKGILSTSPAPTAAPAEPAVGDTPNEPDPIVWREFQPQRQALELPLAVSPVRRPYSVQLTDPIIMIRGQGRMPNLVVIELFP